MINFKIIAGGLLFIVAFICSPLAFGQTNEAKELLMDIIKSYKSNSNFSCDFTMSSFEGYEGDSIKEFMKGYYMKENNNTYTKMDGKEIISCAGFTLKISRKDNLISYFPKASYGVAKDQFSITLDSSLLLYSKVSVVNAPSGKGAVLLERENNMCEKMYIEFDKKNNLVNKLVLYYNFSYSPIQTNSNYWSSASSNKKERKQRIEILYTNIITNTPINERMFLLDTYLLKNANRKFVCAGEYKNFKLK